MNLSKYVQSFLFMDNFLAENTNLPFDVIVYLWERPPLYWNRNFSLPVLFLLEWWSDWLVQFRNIQQKYSRILCVLDQVGVEMVWQYDWFWNNFDGIVVNLFTGISSFGHKIAPEFDDIIVMQNYWFIVVEPYDLWNLLEIMKRKSKIYVRLTGLEMSAKLLQDEDERVREDRLLSMDKFGLWWEFATLLTSANYLWSLIQTAHILNQQEIFVDVYALLDYNFSLRDDLRKSVLRTQKLIVILDQQKNISLEKQIVSQFPLQKWLHISFIYPKYERICAYMDEYRPDQAEFDQVGLMERIMLEKK